MSSKRWITFVFLLLAGCNYTVNKNPGGPGGGGPTAASALSFANVQSKVLNTSCMPCHASPRNASGVNLEKYENVFANREAIRAAVASGSMPPAGMTDDKKQLLISWIDAGALVDTPPGTEVPKPGDPQPVPTPTDDHGGEDHDDDDDDHDDDHGGRRSGLTWENVNARVIQTSCKGCHSAPANRGGVNLETYENVFAKRSSIKRAVESGEMPPRGMSEDKKDLLIAWIEAGAPRGSGTRPQPTPRSTPAPIATPEPPPQPTPEPTPAPTPQPVACAPDFAEVYSQIIEPKCTGCHSSGGGAAGIELDTYDLVFANRLKVREAVSEKFMPPRRPLEDPQIKLLVDWIDAGAPEKKPENCSNLITEVGT